MGHISCKFYHDYTGLGSFEYCYLAFLNKYKINIFYHFEYFISRNIHIINKFDVVNHSHMPSLLYILHVLLYRSERKLLAKPSCVHEHFFFIINRNNIKTNIYIILCLLYYKYAFNIIFKMLLTFHISHVILSTNIVLVLSFLICFLWHWSDKNVRVDYAII